MNAIVCVDENFGIGKNNNLLFSIPDDMEFFKQKTKDSIVIMGRKTLFSFKNKAPLKNRINIVLTKDEKIQQEYDEYDNIYFVDDKLKVYEIIKQFPDRKVFVIGGETIYKLFISEVSTIYMTKMFTTFPADSYFPDIKNHGFVLTDESVMKEYENIKYKYLEYHKNT